LKRSGLTLESLDSAVDVYLNSRKVILCYGMGITHHSHGTANVQQLANFLMLRGNIGLESLQSDRMGFDEFPVEKAF
ncbi:hypothetical protein ACCT04_37405, partial [Rhizobium ruizarguesonis]